MMNQTQYKTLNVLTNNVKAEGLSDKYSLINTKGLIDVAEKSGFSLHSVRVPRGRSPVAMHVVRLNLPNFTQYETKGNLPQIIIQNAHNGTSSLRIMVGIFRLVCTNGLIAGDATLNIRLRHVGLKQATVEEALQVAAQKTIELMPVVERLQGIKLTQEQAFDFAKEALILKCKLHGLSESETNSALVGIFGFENINNLLRPVRLADQEDSLWNVFNRVQEKLVKFSRLYYVEDETTIYKTLRATSGIVSNTKLNQGLWELAEKQAA